MRIRTLAVLVAACALCSAVLAQDGTPPKPGAQTSARPTAESAFAELRRDAAANSGPALATWFPTKLVDRWKDASKDDGKAWRAAITAQVAKGEVVTVRESGDFAVARWKIGADVDELCMQFADGRWNVAAPWAYRVGGPDLSRADGAKPSHVRLRRRTEDDTYGDGALSFTHVTQDARECLNRMEMWLCRNGDFHMRHSSIAELAVGDLAGVDGIPVDVKWATSVTPHKGAVYVARVSSPNRSDFHVALRVTAVTGDAVEFDWRLVSVGVGAPATIHTAQPLVSRDGADGCDGNCGATGK